MRAAACLWLSACAFACGSHPPLPKPVLPLTLTPDSELLRAPPTWSSNEMRLTPPAVHVAQLANGMTIAIVTSRSTQSGTMFWVNRTGGACGPAADEGLAALTARMLLRGTRLSDGRVLRQPGIDGSRVRAAVSDTAGYVGLSVFGPRLPLGMDVLGSVIRDPVFDDVEFGHALTANADVSMKTSWQTISQLEEAIVEGLRGRGHCVSRNVTGRIEALQTRRPRDVIDFYARRWGPTYSALVVVSALPQDRVMNLAEEHFGGWRANESQVIPGMPPYSALNEHRPVVVISATAPLADWMVGFPVPGASNSDSIALALGARVLSGSMVSRANMALRHTAGSTYGVQTAFVQRPDAGELLIWSSGEPKDVASSLRFVLEAAKRLGEIPVAQSELDVAKAGYLAEAANALSTPDRVAGVLAALYALGLPFDHYATLESRVDAVSPKDVRAVVSRWLDPKVAQLGAYGDFSDSDNAYDMKQLGDITWEHLEEND